MQKKMRVVIFNENIANKVYHFRTPMSFWTQNFIDKLQNMVEVFLSWLVSEEWLQTLFLPVAG